MAVGHAQPVQAGHERGNMESSREEGLRPEQIHVGKIVHSLSMSSNARCTDQWGKEG